jgi:DinB family protein
VTGCVIPRPAPDEYAAYYGKYIVLVPEGDLCDLLGRQLTETLALLRRIPESRGTHRYAPGKWSLKEVLGHIGDTERIMSYRALRIARGDTTPLPGFEQDDYVPAGRFEARTFADLGDELSAIRRATVALFRHLDPAALALRGTASGNPFTPRALAYVIAGHERHHMAIVKARYLESVESRA